jgi:hypothetical protein
MLEVRRAYAPTLQKEEDRAEPLEDESAPSMFGPEELVLDIFLG